MKSPHMCIILTLIYIINEMVKYCNDRNRVGKSRIEFRRVETYISNEKVQILHLAIDKSAKFALIYIWRCNLWTN